VYENGERHNKVDDGEPVTYSDYSNFCALDKAMFRSDNTSREEYSGTNKSSD
jgi:hypothetical protein